MKIKYSLFILGVFLVVATLFTRFSSILGIKEINFLNILVAHGSKSSIVLGLIFIICSFSLNNINIILSPYTKIFHVFLCAKYGSYLTLKKPGQISIYTYCFLLSLFSLIIFIVSGKHTSFHWATTADIPIIIRLIDPEFLQNDL